MNYAYVLIMVFQVRKVCKEIDISHIDV